MDDFPVNRRQFGQGMFAVSLMGIMAAAGCSTSSGGAAVSPSSLKGGTLTLGAETDLSLNPAKAGPGTAAVLTQAVFGRLLQYAPDGSIVGGLAESYSANADKTLFTLKLRSGLVFSDGTALDAAAVKASIDYMKTAGGAGRPARSGP